MNGKAGDVLRLGQCDGAIVGDAGIDLGALVVLCEAKYFNPVTTAEFERPRYEANVLGKWVGSPDGIFAEPLKLLLPRCRREAVAGTLIHDSVEGDDASSELSKRLTIRKSSEQRGL